MQTDFLINQITPGQDFKTLKVGQSCEAFCSDSNVYLYGKRHGRKFSINRIGDRMIVTRKGRSVLPCPKCGGDTGIKKTYRRDDIVVRLRFCASCRIRFETTETTTGRILDD